MADVPPKSPWDALQDFFSTVSRSHTSAPLRHSTLTPTLRYSTEFLVITSCRNLLVRQNQLLSVEMLKFFEEDEERVLAALDGPTGAEQSDVSLVLEWGATLNLKRKHGRGPDERPSNKRPRDIFQESLGAEMPAPRWCIAGSWWIMPPGQRQ
eukprot:scaffold24991_cov54-Phaeocystis_antarctica.AAC.1